MDSSRNALTVVALLIALAIAYLNYSNNDELGSSKKDRIEVDWAKKSLKINGKKVETKAEPYLNGDVAMIPFQDVIQGLGGTVSLDKDTGTILVDYQDNRLNAYVDNNYIFLGNIKKTLDAVPVLKDNDIFVSSRFFVDVLGFQEEKRTTSLILNKEFVVFKDLSVESYVREYLGKQSDGFSKEELKRITKLELNGKEIKNLEGLQHFENLQILSLKNNKIEDIRALKSLKNLTEINLEDNLIEDIRPLNNCTKLENVNVSQNKIKNIGSFNLLKKLKRLNISKNRLGDDTLSLPSALEYLDVSDNNISSTRVLKDAKELKVLNLNNNPIMEAESLKNLTRLKTVYLWGYTSIDEIIKSVAGPVRDRCSAVECKRTEVKVAARDDPESNGGSRAVSRCARTSRRNLQGVSSTPPHTIRLEATIDRSDRGVQRDGVSGPGRRQLTEPELNNMA